MQTTRPQERDRPCQWIVCSTGKVPKSSLPSASINGARLLIEDFTGHSICDTDRKKQTTYCRLDHQSEALVPVCKARLYKRRRQGSSAIERTKEIPNIWKQLQCPLPVTKNKRARKGKPNWGERFAVISLRGTTWDLSLVWLYVMSVVTQAFEFYKKMNEKERFCQISCHCPVYSPFPN